MVRSFQWFLHSKQIDEHYQMYVHIDIKKDSNQPGNEINNDSKILLQKSMFDYVEELVSNQIDETVHWHHQALNDT